MDMDNRQACSASSCRHLALCNLHSCHLRHDPAESSACMCCVQVWLLLGASGVAVGLMAGALEVLNRIDMPGAHMPSRRSESTAELTGQLRSLHSSSMSALVSWVSKTACRRRKGRKGTTDEHRVRSAGSHWQQHVDVHACDMHVATHQVKWL
jgi:hypothetical protein